MKKRRIYRKRNHFPHSAQVPMGSELRLSLCMIVKNEASNLAACIQPLKPVVDEIVLVDTGSTDGTKEIGMKLGAKVFEFLWCDDFSAARNESIRHATGDYILWLDADDRVDETEIEKIRLLKKILSPKKNKAYYLIINSQSPLDGETRFLQMRVFPNIEGAVFEGRVHEQIFHNLKRMGIELVQTDIVIRHVGYSDINVVLKKSERNLKIIENELTSDPDNFMLHYNAARTLAGISRQAKAITHLKRITNNEKVQQNEKRFFFEASLLLGKYYTELKLYDEAISIFKGLSRDYEGNGLVHFYLGQTLFLIKDYKGAIEELSKSLLLPLEISMFPVNIDRIRYYQYYTLGKCHMETGEDDIAKEIFLKSLDRHKDHYKSLELLGLLSLKNQQLKEAIEYYERAIEEGKASDKNFTNLGLACRKLGFWDEAEKALIKALEINPQRIEALTNLGYLYHKMKAYPKASDCFMKALNLDPTLKDVRLALSDIHFRHYDLENLVEQCDALMNQLELPRNIVLESFEDLSVLYEKIGEGLSQRRMDHLSLMAYHVSFMIHPSRAVLNRIISMARVSGVFESSIEKIQEVLVFRKKQGQEVPSLEGFFNQA